MLFQIRRRFWATSQSLIQTIERLGDLYDSLGGGSKPPYRWCRLRLQTLGRDFELVPQFLAESCKRNSREVETENAYATEAIAKILDSATAAIEHHLYVKESQD